MPRPVRSEYVRSDSAAPIPVKNAAMRPLLSVRWMTSIPIGPIGADTKTPISNPDVNM